MRIRRAEPADWAAMADIYRAASLSNATHTPALLANPETLLLSDEVIVDGCARVATDPTGRVVGFASARRDGNLLEVEDLFVHPSRMRQGIGSALIEDIRRQAVVDQIQRMEVVANPHAVAFYREVGFIETGRVDTRFGPALRMAVDLMCCGRTD